MSKQNTNRNNDGRTFQALLEKIHVAYESRGIARIRKTDPPVRVMGPPNKARVVFQPNPWLDYAGSWTVNDGRMIIIEAKATVEPSLRIIGEGMSGSGISHSQLVNAEAWRDAGAAVAFLWHYAGEIRIFTPAMVRAALTARKSLRWLDVHKIQQGAGFIVFDYLSALFALTRRVAGGTLPDAKPSDTLLEISSRGQMLCQEDRREANAGQNDHASQDKTGNAPDGRPLVTSGS